MHGQCQRRLPELCDPVSTKPPCPYDRRVDAKSTRRTDLPRLAAGGRGQRATLATTKHGPVGIVVGEPKCCKSFLALDMAVSVAGGVPCLRRFTPMQTGRVLRHSAEDALQVVWQRLAGIAAAAGRALADLFQTLPGYKL